MGVVADLDENETVLASARPHFNYFVKPILFFMVVIAVTVVVLWQWKSAPSWSGFVGLGIYVLCSGYVLFKILKWRSTEMTVTTFRVIFSSGVAVKTVREIPNSKVTSWYCRSGIWQRMVKAGTVILEIPEVQLPQITDSSGKKFRKKFLAQSHPKYEVAHPEEMMKALRKGVLPWRQDMRISQNEGEMTDKIARQLIILADLHRAGALSDEEFKRKSQDILTHD